MWSPQCFFLETLNAEGTATMIHDTLGAMLTFAKVVETSSFSEAGRKLGMSKSAVSKQVSRLEDRLGVRLLNRTTRRVSATEVGLQLYERCQRIAGELEDAENAIMHHTSAPRGVLRVNAPMSFGHLHLAPLLSEFMQAYPDLTIELGLTDRMVDLVDDGIDVAIRIAKLKDSSHFARKLCDARLIAIASPSYRDTYGLPQTPEELADHRCITYSLSAVTDGWRLTDRDGEKVSCPVSGPIRVDNGDALLQLVMSGVGIGMLPTFFCGSHLRDGRVVRVLPDYDDPFGGIYALYPHNRNLSPKVRAFIDFMAKAFDPMPPWERDATE